MQFREYVATPLAVAQARQAGLFGETAKRLARAARRSAPYTSEWGNRRFKDFALMIQGNEITGVVRLAPHSA